eukprot:PhF_6_TR3490/c0_g1_i2/m.5128
MEFGKLVSHGITFYLTLEPGILSNRDGQSTKTYYAATAVDSYPDAFYYFTHTLCRPRTAVGVLRWHEAHEKLLGPIPYDVFVERVRGVRLSLYEIVAGNNVGKACGAELAEVQRKKAISAPTPREHPKKYFRDTLISCCDQSCQTPMASDFRSVQNNRILQVGHGMARRQLCHVDNTIGKRTLEQRALLRSKYRDVLVLNSNSDNNSGMFRPRASTSMSSSSYSRRKLEGAQGYDRMNNYSPLKSRNDRTYQEA